MIQAAKFVLPTVTPSNINIHSARTRPSSPGPGRVPASADRPFLPGSQLNLPWALTDPPPKSSSSEKRKKKKSCIAFYGAVCRLSTTQGSSNEGQVHAAQEEEETPIGKNSQSNLKAALGKHQGDTASQSLPPAPAPAGPCSTSSRAAPRRCPARPWHRRRLPPAEACKDPGWPATGSSRVFTFLCGFHGAAAAEGAGGALQSHQSFSPSGWIRRSRQKLRRSRRSPGAWHPLGGRGRAWEAGWGGGNPSSAGP